MTEAVKLGEEQIVVDSVGVMGGTFEVREDLRETFSAADQACPGSGETVISEVDHQAGALKGFRVIDRRGEDRPEPKPDLDSQAIVNQLVTGITGPVTKAEHHAPPRARAGIGLGEMLKAECPHCLGVNSSIDQHTIRTYKEGKPFLMTCENDKCATQFMIKRPLAIMHNAPPGLAKHVRMGTLPGLPARR